VYENGTPFERPDQFAAVNETEPLLSYECHEGNYGLRNILSAARAEERKNVPAEHTEH
jgi:hypothetical protein